MVELLLEEGDVGGQQQRQQMVAARSVAARRASICTSDFGRWTLRHRPDICTPLPASRVTQVVHIECEHAAITNGAAMFSSQQSSQSMLAARPRAVGRQESAELACGAAGARYGRGAGEGAGDEASYSSFTVSGGPGTQTELEELPEQGAGSHPTPPRP